MRREREKLGRGDERRLKRPNRDKREKNIKSVCDKEIKIEIRRGYDKNSKRI